MRYRTIGIAARIGVEVVEVVEHSVAVLVDLKRGAGDDFLQQFDWFAVGHEVISANLRLRPDGNGVREAKKKPAGKGGHQRHDYCAIA